MTKKCFIVMSGGILENGDLPPHVIDRCEHVIKNSNESDIVIFSSIFSLNTKQKLNKFGFVKSEAKETFNYCNKNPKFKYEKCFLENSSFDSIGSIYFSLNLALNLKINISCFEIISSDFHIQRCNIIAKNMRRLMKIQLPISLVGIESFNTSPEFIERTNHEKSQAHTAEKMLGKFLNINEFCMWLYSSHTNYSTNFNSKALYEDKHLY